MDEDVFDQLLVLDSTVRKEDGLWIDLVDVGI